MSRAPALVMMDLDGTLVDSVPDLAYCVDEMMRRLGRPLHGEARVRDWVGSGIERLCKHALLGGLDGEPDMTEFERAHPLFLEFYDANTSGRSRLYPGVREGLGLLRRHGIPRGCVTNKPMRFAEPLLRNLGVWDEVELVVAGDTLPERKPHPLPLLHAAEHFGVEPGDALLVGDSINDVKAARAAGYRVVCVSYGYNRGEDILTANPDGVIDSLAELPLAAAFG